MKHLESEIELDPFTYGGSPAAIKLAEIIGRCSRYQRRKVTSLIAQSCHKFRKIAEAIDDLDLRLQMLTLYRNHKFLMIDSKSWSKEIKSFTKNVLSQHVRKYELWF